MYLLFFIILLVVSATVILTLHSSKYSTHASMVHGNETEDIYSTENILPNREPKFRGFVIEPGPDCCQASLELQRVTFTHKDWISLPLSGCDRKVCRCQTKEIKDRRKHHRRAGLERRSQIRFDMDSEDRRLKKGRREQDNLWSGAHIY